MRTTAIISENFKEFFSIPKYATYQLKDVNYKKTIILEKNLNQDDNQDTMVS